MSSINIENLTFAYPGSYDNIFEDVNIQMDTDWKLGFVGRNGRGKTTLLQLLQGKYPYSGRISSSVPFSYFPYPVQDMGLPAEEVLQQVCPLAEEWELLRELSERTGHGIVGNKSASGTAILDENCCGNCPAWRWSRRYFGGRSARFPTASGPRFCWLPSS